MGLGTSYVDKKPAHLCNTIRFREKYKNSKGTSFRQAENKWKMYECVYTSSFRSSEYRLGLFAFRVEKYRFSLKRIWHNSNIAKSERWKFREVFLSSLHAQLVRFVASQSRNSTIFELSQHTKSLGLKIQVCFQNFEPDIFLDGSPWLYCVL